MRTLDKILLAATLLLSVSFVSLAQRPPVNWGSNKYVVNRNANVMISVKDSLTQEAVAFASVYLIPEGDSTITNFSLTDTLGRVMLPDVTFGKYKLNVEFLGYKPVLKTFEAKELFQRLTVLMQEDKQALAAAQVTGIANPMEFKGDTLVYNAAAYQVGANAKLRDLLRLMPGVEVDNGSVTVNGEAVKRITVGGRTFLFDNVASTVNNLPAQVVEKVSVYDDQSTKSKFSGVDDGTREKVMDLSFKPEYRKGWFGNAKISGGTTLRGDEGSSNELMADRNLLYNANAMVSAYTEEEQYVLLATSQNADDDISRYRGSNGLNTSHQIGANASTYRIKDMEASAMVSWNSNDSENIRRTSRTDFQASGEDLMSNSSSTSSSGSDSFSIRGRIESDRNSLFSGSKKYMLSFSPTLTYSRNRSNSTSQSERYSESGMLNSSESFTGSEGQSYSFGENFSFGYRDFGKRGRRVNLSVNTSFSNGNTDSWEDSETKYYGSRDDVSKHLLYDTDNNSYSVRTNLTYVEPLAKRIYGEVGYNFSSSGSVRDKKASDASGINDYYSSYSDNDRLSHTAHFQLQYFDFQSPFMASIAMDVAKEKNKTFSRSFGVESLTGDEWLLRWNPRANVSYRNRNLGSAELSYNGSSSQPNNSSMFPVLDISNPTRITTGNIYLRPSYTHDASFRAMANINKQSFTSASFRASASVSERTIVNASWFDASGVQYSIPVNSNRPGYSFGFGGNFHTGFGSSGDGFLRRLNLGVDMSWRRRRSVSYQSTSVLEGLNINSFDYDEFMSAFWGDSSGNIFYSGQSGFSPSNTVTTTFSPSANLSYRGDSFHLWVSASTNSQKSSYSLDSKANTHTWRSTLGGDVTYNAPAGFEFNSNLTYIFYKGYSNGFGEPECKWDIGIAKNIKAISLTLKVTDILNKTRALSRTETDNYVQDSYNAVLGRYFLAGITFSFGKSGTKQTMRAQEATSSMTGETGGFRMMYGGGGRGSRGGRGR